MNFWLFAVRKLIAGIPLVFGVTLVSFTLMVYFGPDLTYELLGKNPSPESLSETRVLLGYDQPFWQRYANYLSDLIRLDLGFSMVKDQAVNQMLAQAIPISLQLMLPGFIFGNLLALLLAIFAVKYRSQWPDKFIMTAAVLGMSISFIVVIIGFQLIFSSSYGMNLFPVRGWSVYTPDGNFSLIKYAQYVTVPTLAIVFVSLGYNTRFFRAVLVEQQNKDYITTAKAFGHHFYSIHYKYMLKNAMIPILTRVVFSIPLVVISGSLLIENCFGIPGVGLITFDAIVAGDQPVLKAVVGLTAVLFVLAFVLAEILYRCFDPRIEQFNS